MTNTSTCGALVKKAENSDIGTWYCIVNMSTMTETGREMVADIIKTIDITVTNPNTNHTKDDELNYKENDTMIMHSEKAVNKTEKRKHM